MSRPTSLVRSLYRPSIRAFDLTWEAFRDADHHREDVLGHALGVRPRRVDDQDAPLGRGR